MIHAWDGWTGAWESPRWCEAVLSCTRLYEWERRGCHLESFLLLPLNPRRRRRRRMIFLSCCLVCWSCSSVLLILSSSSNKMECLIESSQEFLSDRTEGCSSPLRYRQRCRARWRMSSTRVASCGGSPSWSGRPPSASQVYLNLDCSVQN